MLRLYNTLSRQEEAFAPERDNTVSRVSATLPFASAAARDVVSFF